MKRRKSNFLLKGSSVLATSVMVLSSCVPQSVNAGMKELILYIWSLIFGNANNETKSKGNSENINSDNITDRAEDKNVDPENIEKVEKIKKDKKSLAELCEKLGLVSETDEKGNIVINFSKKEDEFKPKFCAHNYSEFGNKAFYPVHKIVYNVSLSELFMYSRGYNFGDSPMRLDSNNTVEGYVQNILYQKRIFIEDPVGKVKQGLQEFFKDVKWGESKDNKISYKGTVNVQGIDFPISLELKTGSEEDKLCCSVNFANAFCLECDCFGTKEKEELTCFMNRLTYCLGQFKKLESTGKFEKVFFDAENGHLVISLKGGCVVKCERRYSRDESSCISSIGFNLCNGCAYTLKVGDNILDTFLCNIGSKENIDFAKKEQDEFEKFISSICAKFGESENCISISANERCSYST